MSLENPNYPITAFVSYHHKMLRYAVICVLSTMVQSQTCANVPAAYSGGLCDGTKFVMTKCMSVGEPAPTSSLINGSRFTVASCENDMTASCNALGGYFKSDYCDSRGQLASPFCRNMAVSTASGSCKSDADCKTVNMTYCRSALDCNKTTTLTWFVPIAHPTVICCSDIRTAVKQGCTDIDRNRLDMYVNIMQDSKQCAFYPNCISTTTAESNAAIPSVCNWTFVVLVPLILLFVFT